MQGALVSVLGGMAAVEAHQANSCLSALASIPSQEGWVEVPMCRVTEHWDRRSVVSQPCSSGLSHQAAPHSGMFLCAFLPSAQEHQEHLHCCLLGVSKGQKR